MSDLTAADPSGAPERPPAPDDTAAFQRFYLNPQDAKASSNGLLHRIFVGWWRDRRP